MKTLVFKLFEKVEAATQPFGYVPLHIVSTTAIDPFDTYNNVKYNRIVMSSDTYPLKLKLGTPDLVRFAAVATDYSTYDVVEADSIELISSTKMKYNEEERYVYLCTPEGVTSVADGIIYIEDKITALHTNAMNWSPTTYANGNYGNQKTTYSWMYASDLNYLNEKSFNIIGITLGVYLDEPLKGTYKSCLLKLLGHDDNIEYPFIDITLERSNAFTLYYSATSTFDYSNIKYKVTLLNCTSMYAITNTEQVLYHIDGSIGLSTLTQLYQQTYRFDDTESVNLFIDALDQHDTISVQGNTWTVYPMPTIDTTSIVEKFTAAGKTINFIDYDV